jgi:hypothetical protein
MTPPPPPDHAPKAAPLQDADAARRLVHLGLSPDAARTFAAYHSGAYANFH